MPLHSTLPFLLSQAKKKSIEQSEPASHMFLVSFLLRCSNLPENSSHLLPHTFFYVITVSLLHLRSALIKLHSANPHRILRNAAYG